MNWDEIGPIYCINLTSRPDRKLEAEKIFKKLKINANYHIVDKHPVSGTQGCFESHIKIISKAYDAGAERCLIFEDDATPTSACTKQNFKIALNFMNKNKDWNVFYLGVLPDIRRKPCKVIEKQIYSLQGICTHAYVINRPLMEKLYNMKYIGIPIDYLFMQLEHCYAIYPTMFYQGLSKSDIMTNGFIDKFRNEKLVKFYYGLQEKYAYYIGTPLISPKMILIIIAIFLVYIFTKNIFYCACPLFLL